MIAAQDVIQRTHAGSLWLQVYAKRFDTESLERARRNLADALAMVEVMLLEEPRRIELARQQATTKGQG